jgi:3-methyl-2-oxobutanoate hydroxymethyltransferase
MSRKVTIPSLYEKKSRAEKITMLTAYDYPTACILDEAEIDIILVGDSLGMVVLGYENTLPVTMDEMIHHTKAVSRGAKNTLVVGDMPYLSYHISSKDTIKNAGRFIKEAGAEAVKIEGSGKNRLRMIRKMVDAEIQVMGHLGLTPQSIHQMGGFRVQGRGEENQLIDTAHALEDAGVFSIVLEGIPGELGAKITQSVNVPTIGIGAGNSCDGQVLVIQDLIGLSGGKLPKFVKKYATVRQEIEKAVRQFKKEVEAGSFPAEEHTYH